MVRFFIKTLNFYMVLELEVSNNEALLLLSKISCLLIMNLVLGDMVHDF